MALEQKDYLDNTFKIPKGRKKNQLEEFLKDFSQPSKPLEESFKEFEALRKQHEATKQSQAEAPEEYFKKLGLDKKPEFDQEKADRLKKSAMYNTIGQALTNVVDAIYGAKGAKITKHQDKTTPAILSRYNKMLDDYEQKQFQQNASELQMKIQALRHKETTDRYGRAEERQAEKDIEEKGRYDKKIIESERRFGIETDANIAKAKRTSDYYKEMRSKADIAERNKTNRYFETKKATSKTETAKAKALAEKDKFYVSGSNNEDIEIPKSTYRDIINEEMKARGETLEEFISMNELKGDELKTVLDNIVTDKWSIYYTPPTKEGVTKEYSPGKAKSGTFFQ